MDINIILLHKYKIMPRTSFERSGGEEHRHRGQHKMRIPLGMNRDGGAKWVSGDYFLCQYSVTEC